MDNWICVAPIWVLPDYFGLLKVYGARRVVALSSTSRYTKDKSSDLDEQTVARCLAEGEVLLENWARENGIEWVVLRPTLVYGLGRDKNICEIARFILRFGFFPLLGQADGLRQPVHAEDVGHACLAALEASHAVNRSYNISGGETLTYREMVIKVFIALGRRPRLMTIPIGVFRLAIAGMHLLPRYRHWSAAMAERMSRDLIFDHADAARDLSFSPRSFRPSCEDLPQ